MKEKNMTALICCFVREYHYNNSNIKIYSDKYANKILSKEEYDSISKSMIEGINFFNPNFKGTTEESLNWIVNNRLAPSVVCRSAFNRMSLETAIKIGCKQYIVYASGYDTSTLTCKIKSYEVDRSEMIEDKIRRIKEFNIDNSNIEYIKCDFTQNDWIRNIINSSYNPKLISFNNLSGISYYLTKKEFSNMINEIANIICNGSSILFDYQTNEESVTTLTNEKLASGADEKMKSKYNYEEIQKILSDNGFKIYEYLSDEEITKQYCYNYNTLNPNDRIVAPKGVAYVLAVKK